MIQLIKNKRKYPKQLSPNYSKCNFHFKEKAFEISGCNLVDPQPTEVNARHFNSFSDKRKSLHRRDNRNYSYL